MSTDELDVEFKASGAGGGSARRQSTAARKFADQLDKIFLLDESLNQLDRTVNNKKDSVSYQNSELAVLEARLKQAERLLEEKRQQLAGEETPSSGTRAENGISSPVRPRQAMPDYVQNPSFSSTPDADSKKIEEEQEVEDGPGRPAPPAPREKEYVVVEKTPSVVENRATTLSEPQQYQASSSGRA